MKNKSLLVIKIQDGSCKREAKRTVAIAHIFMVLFWKYFGALLVSFVHGKVNTRISQPFCKALLVGKVNTRSIVGFNYIWRSFFVYINHCDQAIQGYEFFVIFIRFDNQMKYFGALLVCIWTS
ncbi:uncharacterized protein LOC133299914 isoform X1 [Gastrolobium bilobum]|uniref:uncharacterized protein LOC133299914 isoform X1 n=1 Tax=Gastrolobium bilobum TaxID=150636 RepID=UPI002AB248B2|nr:uncharacterized protein LOC133299914 isoform X1 [Gastrolobium bilobum]XP_061355393.1 uncharacterized protein LOC133299914 isoform X1 [Gastrolobium bilobum]